jgi:hypothetical protein
VQEGSTNHHENKKKVFLLKMFSANKLSYEWRQKLLAGTWQTFLFLKTEGKQPDG